MINSVLSENIISLIEVHRIIGLTIILVVGFAFAKLFEVILKRLTNRERFSKYFAYFIVLGVLIYGLFYFNPGTFNLFSSQLSSNADLIINILFVIIIGVIIVSIVMWIFDWIADVLKIKEYFGQIGLGSEFVTSLEIFIKIILYLVILEVVIIMLNLKSTLINTVILSIAIAVIALFTGLIFYGLKDFFLNWFNSLTLKTSDLFRPGQKIKFGEISGEIVSVNSYSTILDNGRGEYLWIPNSKLASSEIFIQKSKFDLKSLEEFRNNFKGFSLIGGYLSMILEFLGVKFGKRKLYKYDERNWKKTFKFVKEITKSEVSGLMVPYRDIINLKEEIKGWLVEGGFVLLRFYKPTIFPGIKKKRETLALCVGVDGNQLVIVDLNPRGGVYMINYKDIEHSIDELEEKYYIVFAKRGSNAFLRIKNKLYYSNPEYYESMNKTAERKLKQIVRKTEIIEKVFPESVREAVNKYKEMIR